MKKINTLLALLSALLLLGACEKDGEKFYLSSPVESDLIASTNAVVLTEATAKLYALSLAWSDQTLQISDPRYQATSGIQTTVQVSRSEDFSGSIIESTENGVSKSYTVAALNIIAYKLNAPAEEAAPLYFRLAGSNGSNIAPVYSNTVAVTVTPYPIDMHYASIINKGSGQDSGQDFYSANADGQYSGFFGAAAWEGIYVQEADGTTWHTAQSGWSRNSILVDNRRSGRNMGYVVPRSVGMLFRECKYRSETMERLTDTRTECKRHRRYQYAIQPYR